MKDYFNSYYNDYRREVFKIGIGITTIQPSPVKKFEPVEEEYDEKEDTRFFLPLFSSNDSLFVKARQICDQRKIPFSVYKDWYVATCGRYAGRLVIPYRDHENKIYSYQCRSLNGEEPKYLSRKNNSDNIYGFYTVDRSKPVIILEGAIDSLFIENAIGCTGLKVQDPRLKEFPHRYFLLDNDVAGRKMSLTLIGMGEKVFVWKQFLMDFQVESNKKKDDINDFMLKIKRKNALTFKELEPYFTNNPLKVKDGFYK